jgi:hypothetical protein
MILYGTHLGQVDSDDVTSLLTATDPNTNLPYLLEISLGLLAVALVARTIGGAKTNYKRRRKKRLATKAKRTALQAQLASL